MLGEKMLTKRKTN